MASEATWQTGGGHRNGETPGDGPMDQRTVESLLRRLVERVEESERRYSDALDELHARLDQLSQTTDAARAAGAPEDSASLDRLHEQVSNLARRFEPQTANPLDDFERLGKALSANLDFTTGGSDALSGAAESGNPFASFPSAFPSVPSAFPSTPSAFAPLAETPAQGRPDFNFKAPEFSYPAPSLDLPPLQTEAGAIDKRVVDMAHKLEHSLGAVMPADTIEALNARLDEIASQLSQALRQAPKLDNLASVEKQLSEMGQQLGRAEAQLARVSGIEDQLVKLIERFDTAPDVLEEIASKAATEAAKLVTASKPATEERLDAMHRDLVAMSDKARLSDERLASTLQAVHDSLKQLVLQVEKGSDAAFQTPQKPRAPFADRARAEQGFPPPPPGLPPFQHPGMPPQGAAPRNGTAPQAGSAEVKDQSPKTKLGGGIPDFQESEPPAFGRGKRGAPDENAVDLDASVPRRARAGTGLDAEFDHDDLVAAARRASQAAALKAEERSASGRARRSPATVAPGSVPGADAPSKRKRSLLMIAAAILLLISAALLYGRLGSKPETSGTPPAAEESVPGPAGPDQITPLPDGSRHGTVQPGADLSAPAPVEPGTEAAPPATSGASELDPGVLEDDSSDNAATGFNQGIDPSPDDAAPSATAGGFSDVAKSSYRAPATSSSAETMPRPQLASLKSETAAALPPGVSLSLEEPTLGGGSQSAPVPLSLPGKLPLPPEALGALSLRQAASGGDARAQYVIALRYAQGQGIAQDLTEAAHWLERAASAGLAPAQYRLASMYERGQGVTKDLGKARSWYGAAAVKGNVKAMHNLAVSASAGDQADYVLAAKWYGTAAGYGLADSQYNLGILAEHGLGMPKNLTAAYEWFALAAKNGDAEAAKRRDLVKAQLDAKTLATADQTVKSWQPKPAIAEANEVAQPEDWTAQAEAPNGSLITRAQKLLNKLGYDAGPANGQLGEQTRDAVKSFERRNGLEETGEVSIPLVTKLERLTS